jgi:hypothetical protein
MHQNGWKINHLEISYAEFHLLPPNPLKGEPAVAKS